MSAMELAPLGGGLADRRTPEGAVGALHSVPDVALSQAERRLGNLWDRHGGAVYALACTLLGDEEAAIRAVTLGLADFARSTGSESGPDDDARRSMARHVYWRSRELAGKTPRTLEVPQVMVWLGRLAQLQRECLALCLLGGHTYRQTAELLDVPPALVADLLTDGLRDLGRLVGGAAATSA